VNRDLAGEDVAGRTEQYNFLYFRTFEGFLAGVAGQYAVFGNPEVMVPKLAVTQIPNFTVVGCLFGHRKLTDAEFMGSILQQFPRTGLLAARVSQLFSDWGEMEGHEWEYVNPRLQAFPAPRLLRNLAGGYDDETLKVEIENGLQLFEGVAVMLFHKVLERLPDLEVDENTRLNPAAVSVHPERWEEDGLFDENGISLVEARERVPGWEELWLENHYPSPAK
jgi:hypothetical protein